MRKISVADLQNLGAVARSSQRAAAEPAPYGDKVYWGMELPPVYVVVDPLPLVPYYYYYNSCACGQDEVRYYSQDQSYHSYLYCYYVTSSYTTEVWYYGGEGYTGSSDGGSEIPTIDLSNVFFWKNEESRVQLKPLVEDFYDTIAGKVFTEYLNGKFQLFLEYNQSLGDGIYAQLQGRVVRVQKVDVSAFRHEVFHFVDKQYGQSVDGNCEIAVRLFEYHINDHSQDGAYALQINQLYSALQNASWDISKVSDKVWQDMVDVLQQSPAYAKCTFDKSLFVVGGLVEMIEKYREWLLGKIF